MFKDLIKLPNLTKFQLKKVNSLSENFSENNKSHLEKANNLLFELWYSDNIAGVQIMLESLTKIEFKDNFNLWAFIEPSYCLKYYLTKDIETRKKIRKILTEDVKSKLDSNQEHRQYLDKVRDGLLIEMSKRSLNKSSSLNDESQEYGYRTSLLISYLHLFALGATGKISEQECLNEIESNLTRLRFLYKKLNK